VNFSNDSVCCGAFNSSGDYGGREKIMWMTDYIIDASLNTDTQ
jgi:hypothetical protein